MDEEKFAARAKSTELDPELYLGLKDDLPEELKPFGRFMWEINRESERGCALVSCSHLDELLRTILEAFFINGRSKPLLEGFNAPLGTLSTRATTAFALGLITEVEFKEIEYLRRIRNEFAHSMSVSFETQKIIDLVKNLKMALRSRETTPKELYVSSAFNLAVKLLYRADVVGQHRREVVDWPFDVLPKGISLPGTRIV